jgi:hypothetical protein
VANKAVNLYFRTGTPKKINFEAQLAYCVGFIIFD